MKRRNYLTDLRRRRDSLCWVIEQGQHGAALATLRADLAEVERELEICLAQYLREVATHAAGA